jgi:hypothetical protein
MHSFIVVHGNFVIFMWQAILLLLLQLLMLTGSSPTCCVLAVHWPIMQVAHLAVWRTAAAADDGGGGRRRPAGTRSGSRSTRPWQQYSAEDSRRILQTAGQGTITLTALDGSHCDVDLSSMQATHRRGSSSPQLRANLDTCIICQTRSLAIPHKLPCGHAFCFGCISPWAQKVATSHDPRPHTCPYRCQIAQGAQPEACTITYKDHARGWRTMYSLRLVLPDALLTSGSAATMPPVTQPPAPPALSDHQQVYQRTTLRNCTTAITTRLHDCDRDANRTTARLHNSTTTRLHECTTAQLHERTTA